MQKTCWPLMDQNILESVTEYLGVCLCGWIRAKTLLYCVVGRGCMQMTASLSPAAEKNLYCMRLEEPLVRHQDTPAEPVDQTGNLTGNACY